MAEVSLQGEPWSCLCGSDFLRQQCSMCEAAFELASGKQGSNVLRADMRHVLQTRPPTGEVTKQSVL